MRVLISGAGVAGLSVAYWLKRYGFTITIVERAPSLLIGGYKIDVRGAALHVLRRMGIYETVVAASTDMQGAMLVDRNGKVIQKMSGDVFGHRAGEDVEIIRGALCQILMDQVLDADFIFGDWIQEITQFSDHIEVLFQYSEAREFDLVIGADGLHSNVRKLVFGEESLFSQELGLYLCVFTVPNYLNLDRLEMQYSELGRVASVWSASGEPNAKACFGFIAPEKVDLRNVEQQQQVLRTVYDGIGWEIPKFLKMMCDSPDFYFDAAAQIHMDHWSQGRVVLLGDAAYCASPMSGQGSSLAIIGAYILAGELGASKDNYQLALQNYENQMRPFVKLNQALGIKAAEVMRYKEKSTLFSWLLCQLMKIVPGYLIKFFINRSTQRINKAANSINLKDY
ncbi:FAD-dependent monooxygenase [Legionella parisiensis]|uniref:2-heptyl-3-hydroxy-4(1H)-quinolone synthase n=1 Tax=Legionella parisiensis TaxID=45071 RepID=A0A1E5JPC7_9GAMM|nr:FAD-dependent monooxygenase [Legionella parisiensis]KTD42028.1 oxidoreductase [Legionella parisiensis]OEH46394.1 2-heptyl-3-hydroxy-4(1H)-quinolone synthase [Legionella parisiensis]STX75491.1 oxidoreductase [Legionella parisiensis]